MFIICDKDSRLQVHSANLLRNFWTSASLCHLISDGNAIGRFMKVSGRMVLWKEHNFRGYIVPLWDLFCGCLTTEMYNQQQMFSVIKKIRKNAFKILNTSKTGTPQMVVSVRTHFLDDFPCLLSCRTACFLGWEVFL